MNDFNVTKEDNAYDNRVELHCHTNMSFKDGIATADEIVSQAFKFGHKAIAITDHGSVRAYPEIANAVKRIKKEGGDIKPIYGVELYFVNDVDSDISSLSEKEIISLRTHLIVLVKNQKGLKNLYKMMSEADLFLKWNEAPVIKRSSLDKYRKDFIIGSACECGELYRAIVAGKSDAKLEKIASYYDYLEIQPLDNNKFMIKKSSEPDTYDKNGNVNANRFKEVTSIEIIKKFNRKVIEIADKLGKPVVATGDVHFVELEDSLIRKILMANQGYSDFEEQAPLYFRTTDEMLEEFSYLGKAKAFEVVVKNTNLIADMIEEIVPIIEGYHPFVIENVDNDLEKICREKANDLYVSDGILPYVIKERLDEELSHITEHNFSSHYMIAYLIVKHLKELGEYVFARGSVGSSFVAYLLGISNVNPLEPHYLCPHCHHTEFVTDGSIYSGFDLPHKACHLCSSEMKSDGHNIPYEMLMGFGGDRLPDIDLNVPATAQNSVKKFLLNYFGKERIAYAAIICCIAPLTAESYIRNYEELSGTTFSYEKKEYIIDKLCNTHTRSGMHPAGLFVLPEGKEFADFTPCCPTESFYLPITQKSAFDFHHLHDTIIKLDILGHIVPDIFKLLHKFTGISPVDVDIQDPKIYKLFGDVTALGISAKDIDGITVGTLGLPEYNNDLTRELLLKTQPKCFTDLIKISGLVHGTVFGAQYIRCICVLHS